MRHDFFDAYDIAGKHGSHKVGKWQSSYQKDWIDFMMGPDEENESEENYF